MANRPLPHRLATAAVLAAVLACAQAAPDERPAASGDAVLQLLQDRGLLPKDAKDVQTEGHPLVQQMRDAASDMVLSAMNFIGVPYRRGGNNANEGFDCSGFTRHVFERSLGLLLPRRSDEQAGASGFSQVARGELKPGDLVFFNTLRRTFSHVGIYVGDGKFIHAPRTGSEVRIEDMRKAYWERRFTGARRADKVSAAPDAPAATASASAITTQR